MEVEDCTKKKYEQNQTGGGGDRLKGIDICGVLVNLVLGFGMYHINNLKVKEIMLLIHYHFGSEMLKGSPKKVECAEAVNDFF